MPALMFKIMGMPQGKGRPKFCKRGDFVTAYTPKKTKEYEDQVRQAYSYAMHQTNRIGSRAFCMDIVASFNAPVSMSKKKQAALIEREDHTGKPDIDNIIKVVADALNEVAFDDDSQMVMVTGRKVYTDNPANVQVTLSWEHDEALAIKEGVDPF